METNGVNLFIVDDNQLMVFDLKNYLHNRFGNYLHISTFNDGESCLKMVNKETHIVILDYYLGGINGLDILKEIKKINPKTEVIMLSGNENIALAIDSFRMGAKDYVVKGKGSNRRITKLVNNFIMLPILKFGKEFGISKYIAVLVIVFVSMAISVACLLQIHW